MVNLANSFTSFSHQTNYADLFYLLALRCLNECTPAPVKCEVCVWVLYVFTFNHHSSSDLDTDAIEQDVYHMQCLWFK